MKIIANGVELTGVRVHQERELIPKDEAALAFEDRPVRRLSIEGGLSEEALQALKAGDWLVTDDAGVQTVHKGFTELLRHEAVFVGHDEDSAVTIGRLTAELKDVRSRLARYEPAIGLDSAT